MKDKTICKLVGAVLLILGIVLFALSIRVGSRYGGAFRFYSWGNVNLGGVLIVLLMVELVGYFALYNVKPWTTITKWALIVTGILFIVEIIVSLNIWLTNMSLLQFAIYLLLVCIGAGLLIRGRLND